MNRPSTTPQDARGAARHGPRGADAERSVRAILEAAERVFGADPSAPLERVAEEAGVARTTVHRRFATREALLDALHAWAADQLRAAVDAARPETSPPMVALYQATVNVLQTKRAWAFAMRHASATASGHPLPDVAVRCEDLLRRARDAGLLRPDADIVWTRRVYEALVDQAGRGGTGTDDPDALARLVLHTLLHGVGTDAARL